MSHYSTTGNKFYKSLKMCQIKPYDNVTCRVMGDTVSESGEVVVLSESLLDTCLFLFLCLFRRSAKILYTDRLRGSYKIMTDNDEKQDDTPLNTDQILRETVRVCA